MSQTTTNNTAAAPAKQASPWREHVRDFFGSHTYRRIDKDGTFHTLWSGDHSEVEAEDTH